LLSFNAFNGAVSVLAIRSNMCQEVQKQKPQVVADSLRQSAHK
jgi:hypothetical protein